MESRLTTAGNIYGKDITARANVTANNVEVNGHIEMHAPAGASAYIDYRSNGRSGDYDWRTFVEQGNAKRIFFRSAANKNVWFNQDGGIGSDKYGPDLGFTGNLSESGYQKLPSGLIIQWGDLSLKSWDDGRYSCYFPIVFPNKAFSITFGTTNSYSHESVRATVLISKTKAKMELHNHIAWNNGEKFRSYFIAIGN